MTAVAMIATATEDAICRAATPPTRAYGWPVWWSRRVLGPVALVLSANSTQKTIANSVSMAMKNSGIRSIFSALATRRPPLC